MIFFRIICILILFGRLSDAFAIDDYSKYVDPFIGTEGGGNVFVGVCLPSGMVKLGPDCGNNDNNSGYTKDDIINGFSHVHVSGTGGGAKYGNVLMMPTTGKVNIEKFGSLRSNEKVQPGYYSVFLNKYNIEVQLTTTHSVGFHKYKFPTNVDANVLIDLGHFLELGKDWGECQEFVGSEVNIVSNKELKGYTRIRSGWNKGAAYTVYFYIVFDQPFSKYGTWKDGVEYLNIKTQPDLGGKTGAYLTFAKLNDRTLQAKVGISFVSSEKARMNIEKEVGLLGFSEILSSAKEKWNSMLCKIKVEGGSKDHKTMFYTALYHSLLMPTNRTGENPNWKSDEPYFDDYYAIWDTFRTTHPLLTIISPELQRDMIRSLIDIYRYDGYMPDARSGNDNGRTQGGSNCDILIADAFIKGIKGVDYETALKGMIKNADVPPGDDERKHGRGGLIDYNTIGYVSTDYERAGTRTVEYASCDFAIATVAKGLGKMDVYEKYLKRSENWKYLWRPVKSFGAKGFIWPRKKDGSWINDFNTLEAGSWKDFFYESQSWELSLYVPHEMPGLIKACGGKDSFESRLDTFFIKSKKNAAGLMDFYNVNNEPGFLTPTLYHWIGKPAKSEERIRSIVKSYFNSSRQGLPGNDDSGAMSSWLGFNLMGFYPVAGQDMYLITTPHFEKTCILLENNKSFTIIAHNLNEKNIYIQAVSLNKHPLDRSWFNHAEIVNGGTIDLIMSDKPSNWGTIDLPK